MPVGEDWSGDNRRTDQERRKILERRRQERIAAADAAADAAAKAGLPADTAKGASRRKVERRRTQICFVCRNPFEPKSSGQVICSDCQLDGVRGSAGSGRKISRF